MDRDKWIELCSRLPTDDECPTGYVLVWHAFQRTMAIKLHKIGLNPMYTHWQPVPATGWILASVCLPTADDGDILHCVLIKDDEGGIMVSGWHRLLHDRFCIAWQHTPPPPANYLKYRKQF